MKLKAKADCRWDLVSLGEVMLRLDPGESRIANSRQFTVCEGGGEYNVARALTRCFSLDTAIVTALVDNPIGRLVEGLIRQGGVDTAHLQWRPHDGAGRVARNGLNFAERGFGLRGGLGCSDRGHTAVSQLKPGDIDWEEIFGEEGARWFHTGGIFCGLSSTTPEVAREAMQAARRCGTRVSYDLNYRESLWRDAGGLAAAQAVNRELVPLADVLLGGTHAIGIELTSDPRVALSHAAEALPNLSVIATTLRSTASASHTDWGALCWASGTFHEAPLRRHVAVLDRIGSGDAFAAGLIQGFLAGQGAQYGVDCGAALGALTMTTPGDSAQATQAEVAALMRDAGADLSR